jgi:hypothetical protein
MGVSMTSLEVGAQALRSAVATPIATMASNGAGVDAWLGRRVGQLVLDAGTPAERSIDAFLPKDRAAIQYVGMLPAEAVNVARPRAVSFMQAQTTLQDARDGVWYVAGLHDAAGAPIRYDEAGAIRQAWQAARFDTNHVAAGSVHGEASEFFLRPDLEQELMRSEIGASMLEHVSPVSTGGAEVALAAAERGGTSMAAPVRASWLPSVHRPVLDLEPLDGLPASIKDQVVHEHAGSAWKDQRFIRASGEGARTATGSIDDVLRAARVMSVEHGGQAIGVFEIGPDEYALTRLVGSRFENDATTPISGATVARFAYSDSGVMSRAPEAKMVVGPTAYATKGRSHEVWDPARAAREAAKHDTASNQTSSDVDRLTELVDTKQARATEIESRLAQDSVPRRDRRRLGKELESLRYSMAYHGRELETAQRGLENRRAVARAELAKVVDSVDRVGLPERDEWVAHAGFLPDGSPRLRDIRPLADGATYETELRGARRTAAGSATEGVVLLRGLDGTYSRASYSVTPDELLTLAKGGVYRGPFSGAVRAITVGGRTVQWDDAGRIVAPS